MTRSDTRKSDKQHHCNYNDEPELTNGTPMTSKKRTPTIAEFFGETVADFDGDVKGQGEFTIERAAQAVRAEQEGAAKKP